MLWDDGNSEMLGDLYFIHYKALEILKIKYLSWLCSFSMSVGIWKVNFTSFCKMSFLPWLDRNVSLCFSTEKLGNLHVWKALLMDCLLCLLLVQGRSILTFTLLFSCFQGCTWKSSSLGLAGNGLVNLHKSILASSKRSFFLWTCSNISHENIKLIIYTCAQAKIYTIP